MLLFASQIQDNVNESLIKLGLCDLVVKENATSRISVRVLQRWPKEKMALTMRWLPIKYFSSVWVIKDNV